MDDFSSLSCKRPEKAKADPGPWYWPLTILAAVLVGGLSLVMAFLTSAIPERDPILMGLIFMVPAGAMFFSAMLLEFRSGAMTPAYTRRPQVMVACVATALTFFCGCLCDWFYTLGGYADAVKPNVILVVDDTGSMWFESNKVNGRTRKEHVVNALDDILDHMNDGYTVGMVVFDYAKHDATAAKPLDKEQRKALDARIAKYRAGRDDNATLFNDALHAALDMAGQISNGKETRIVLLTDGEEGGEGMSNTLFLDAEKNEALRKRARETSSTIYSLSAFARVDENLRKLVEATGGVCAQTDKPEEIFAFMKTFTAVDGDMLRSSMKSAKVYSGVMLVLEGLIIGTGLTLMLSVQGQRRTQLLISPLMGLLAFLLIKILPTDGGWFIEWLGLSLLGVVFMRRNAGKRPPIPRSAPRTRTRPASVRGSAYEEDHF